jgi:hypothetical protein
MKPGEGNRAPTDSKKVDAKFQHMVVKGGQ